MAKGRKTKQRQSRANKARCQSATDNLTRRL